MRAQTLIIGLTGALITLAAASSFAAADECAKPATKTAAVLERLRATCPTSTCATITAVTTSASAAKKSAPTLCLNDSVAALLASLQRAGSQPQIILLGEVHDNPASHDIRAALIEDLADPTATPVVEHIPADSAPALAKFYAEHDRDRSSTATQTDTFFKTVEWSKLGWPAPDMFRELYTKLLQQTPQIVAADPPRSRVRSIARETLASLNSYDRKRLKLIDPLPDAAHNSLLDELEQSHCGLVPRRAFGGMADAQRYRDAHIAAAAVTAATKTGRALVIAGNGHVRKDRGVPIYLRAADPGITIVSIGLLEAGTAQPSPADLKVYDFVITTPRVVREDPCIAMRARMSKPQTK